MIMNWLNKKNKIYLNRFITHKRKYKFQSNNYNNSRKFSQILAMQIIDLTYNRVNYSIYKKHRMLYNKQTNIKTSINNYIIILKLNFNN